MGTKKTVWHSDKISLWPLMSLLTNLFLTCFPLLGKICLPSGRNLFLTPTGHNPELSSWAERVIDWPQGPCGSHSGKSWAQEGRGAHSAREDTLLAALQHCSVLLGVEWEQGTRSERPWEQSRALPSHQVPWVRYITSLGFSVPRSQIPDLLLNS